MKKISWSKLYKFFIVLLLILGVIGFFYFEPLFSLRILVVIAAVFSLWRLKDGEIITLLVSYLWLYGLSNLHYLIGIPLSLSMILVLGLFYFLFLVQTNFSSSQDILEKPVFRVFAWAISLAILEMYVAMDFLPIDPRTKALIVTVVFYLLVKMFYLNAHSMLSFRRMIGYIISVVMIFGLVYLVSLRSGL